MEQCVRTSDTNIKLLLVSVLLHKKLPRTKTVFSSRGPLEVRKLAPSGIPEILNSAGLPVNQLNLSLSPGIIRSHVLNFHSPLFIFEITRVVTGQETMDPV